MSLIPPTPLIMSKLKYLIERKIIDLELRDQYLANLGPFFVFRLRASFRNLVNGEEIALGDIEEYIGSKFVSWDCIDTALNMFTRMKGHLKSLITDPGVLRLSIESRVDGGLAWSDLMIDEFPINVKGIITDVPKPPELRRQNAIDEREYAIA